MNGPQPNTHTRRLSQRSLLAVREAQAALRQAQGFAYLPCLVDADDSASHAYQLLQADLPRQALPLDWPHLKAEATASEIEQALSALNQALDKTIARLPEKSLIYLNASAWPDSPLLQAWPPYLNTRRESLRRKKHGLVLMWPQQSSEALMASAPDMWSMRMLSPWVESENGASLGEAALIQAMTGLGNSATPLAWREQDETAFQTLLRTHSLEQAQLSWADALAMLSNLIEHAHRQKALDFGLCLLGMSENAHDTPDEVQAAIEHNLGLLYHRSGQPDAALTHAERAIKLFRYLAHAQPKSFNHNLAASLNSLANCLSALGLREQAVTVTQEVVALYRHLVQELPFFFEHDLAGNLGNLANLLIDLGQYEQALTASQEAVTIQRHLEPAQAFEADLAMGLNNHARCLNSLGQHALATGYAQEAMSIFRRLAQTQPQAFEPNLAMSLNNLASFLSDLGQHEAALAAAHEAVTIHRRLAQAQPQAFEPDLAMSLNTLANRLSDLGQRETALAAAQEAVTIRRRLAQAQPQAFEPDLAMSLNNLASVLSDLGQREKALEAALEAVALCEKWATLHPEAFAQKLAIAQHNLQRIQTLLTTRQETP